VTATPHCGANFQLDRRKPCNLNIELLYALHNAALHKGVLTMIAAIERVLNALFAPLVRELDRLPPSAVRHLMAGL
jgi:hypothetical protein